MKKETIEEVSERYVNESFVPMRNSDGEILRIPSGQTVPCGFTKHKKVAIKHFTNGYKLALERSYSEEDLREGYEFAMENVQLGRNGYEWVTFDEWFKKFKKK